MTTLRLRSALAVGVTVTAVTLPLTATPAQAITCYSATSGRATWYPGPSASYRYDQRFGNGPVAVPQSVLDAYVPQGLATWGNWDGRGSTLLVYTAYAENRTRALVQGINPSTGARTRIAYVPYSHVGGIVFAGGHAWIAGGGKVSRYSTAQLRGAFRGTSSASLRPTYSLSTYGSSFLSASGGYLFAGRFNQSARDYMHSYRITSTGGLVRASRYQVPMKTQGLVVTSGHFVYSTSYGRNNRSNVYVVKRGYSIDSTRASCFRAPSMSEGMTLYAGRVYVIYESGAHYYNKGLDDPLNPIKRLHQAPLSNLTSLVG